MHVHVSLKSSKTHGSSLVTGALPGMQVGGDRVVGPQCFGGSPKRGEGSPSRGTKNSPVRVGVDGRKITAPACALNMYVQSVNRANPCPV